MKIKKKINDLFNKMGNQEHKSCFIHEFLENFSGKKIGEITDDNKIVV